MYESHVRHFRFLMGNLKIDFGNTLPLEAKAFSILSKPQSTIIVESLFFMRRNVQWASNFYDLLFSHDML